MSDPPGVPSALGIEAVQWVSEAGGSLTVIVMGRWRRRRPEWRGQAILVVEAEGRRHRLPAMPEPPSLTGALPGTWRMTFSVPADLAHHLGRRSYLQLGAVVVPLPMSADPAVQVTAPQEGGAAVAAHDEPLPADAAPAEGPADGEPAGERGGSEVEVVPERQVPADDEEPPGPPPDPEMLASRQLRRYELAVEKARKRTEDAERVHAQLLERIDQLERELAQARREPDRFAALLAESERERLQAEQRAHAERDLRLEAEELAEGAIAAEPSEDEVAELEARIDEVVQELATARREADEAEHKAVAADVARERAERRLEQLNTGALRLPQRAVPAEATNRPLGAELALAADLRSARAGDNEARDREHPPTGELPPLAGLSTELEMVARHGWQSPGGAASLAGTGESPESVQDLRETIAALRRELEARAAAEARAQAMLATAEAALKAGQAGGDELSSTLVRLRDELEQLRANAERERVERVRAEERAAALERELVEQRRRSERAFEAIQQLRELLDAIRTAREGADPPPTHPSGPVDERRLSAALERLRETVPPAEPDDEESERGVPAPEHAERGQQAERGQIAPRAPTAERPIVRNPWLLRVFRLLTARDPTAAGRLLLALLPAQRAVRPLPVAYDLVLADLTSVRVTVGAGDPEIELTDEPRAASEVHFQVRGDLASVARLVAAGPLRRRLGRRVASVEGDRGVAVALQSLVRSRLSVGELYAAGVRLDPTLALTVASLMIDPAWTSGERFTLAHAGVEAPVEGPYLHVRGGERPVVAERPAPGAAVTTIVCPDGELLPVLAGEGPAVTAVSGDQRALSLVQHWLKRAQSA